MHGLAFLPPPRLSLFASAEYSTASVSVQCAASDETQVVPDSVDDPPLLCAESERSQHSILVVETPDRPPKPHRTKHKQRLASTLVGDADKSRVVIQDSSDAEDEPLDEQPDGKSIPNSTVCRFTFFSKSAANVPEASLAAVEPEQDGTDSRGFLRLPSMNVRDATQIALSDQGSLDTSAVGMHSILPPPTLHFSLASVTPLSNILAEPGAYMEPRPWAAHGLGGITSSVNLLVVVKEVADISRVRAKFPVDHPPPQRTTTGQYTRKWDEGRTDRVELVVLDGRMQADAPHVVTEKHMFRIVLWGNLARQWTTEPDYSVANVSAHDTSGSRSASLHIASSREPTALRAGDVIFIENLRLSSPPAEATGPSQTGGSGSGGGKRLRLGAGFPPRTAARAHSPTMHLVGHGSERKSTSLELCYRTDIVHRRDEAHNFDADIARFDPKSRRILELSRLFLSSHHHVRLMELE